MFKVINNKNKSVTDLIDCSIEETNTKQLEKIGKKKVDIAPQNSQFSSFDRTQNNLRFI